MEPSQRKTGSPAVGRHIEFWPSALMAVHSSRLTGRTSFGTGVSRQDQRRTSSNDSPNVGGKTVPMVLLFGRMVGLSLFAG